MRQITCGRCDAAAVDVDIRYPYQPELPLALCRHHRYSGTEPLPIMGHRMLGVLRYVARQPGTCKRDSIVHGGHCPSVSKGYDSVKRLERAGLIADSGGRNRAALYLTSLGAAVIALTGEVS